MTSRAIAVDYKNPAITEANNFYFDAYVLYTDPAIAGSGKVLVPQITLDASTPAGWNAAIKAAIVQIGVDNGFPDLVAANVYLPTYSNA